MIETKTCGKCKQEKPLSEFYTHKRDGYQSNCKECKRNTGRIYNRTPNRRKYNKQFYERLKYNGYFDQYQKRPDVKKRKAEQMKQYSQDPRLRIRFLARWYAKRMTENGTLKQEPCAICGESKTQKHHPNYNEPLLVVWLCVKCHRKLHKSLKDGKQNESSNNK